MPELVKHEDKVSTLRKGDLLQVIVNGHAQWAPITDVVKKQTWGSFTVEGIDKALRMRLDEPIDFKREQPTAAEQEANRRNWTRETIVDDLSKLLRDTPLKKLEAIVAKARVTGGDIAHDVLTSFNLPDVLEAQALFKVALRIRNYVDTERLEDATYEQLVDALAKWWISEYGGLRSYRSSPLSRSTSRISNMLEDLDDWAPNRITEKLWFGDVERRVAAIREEHTR